MLSFSRLRLAATKVARPAVAGVTLIMMKSLSAPPPLCAPKPKGHVYVGVNFGADDVDDDDVDISEYLSSAEGDVGPVAEPGEQ